MGTCGPQRGPTRAGVKEAAAKPPSRLEEQGCQGLWGLCLSDAETASHPPCLKKTIGLFS